MAPGLPRPAPTGRARSRTALGDGLRSCTFLTHPAALSARAADVVKDDVAGPTAPAAYATDKAKAAAKLEARAGIDTLFAVDAGPYAAEARALALLTALDRMEIARGLPKHLR